MKIDVFSQEKNLVIDGIVSNDLWFSVLILLDIKDVDW